MPAKSAAQRRLMAMAEHNPGMIRAKNRGVLSMSKGQLHDFASTPEKGLREHVINMKRKGKLKRKKSNL